MGKCLERHQERVRIAVERVQNVKVVGGGDVRRVIEVQRVLTAEVRGLGNVQSMYNMEVKGVVGQAMDHLTNSLATLCLQLKSE